MAFDHLAIRDVGDGRGRGAYATHTIREGELVVDDPAVAACLEAEFPDSEADSGIGILCERAGGIIQRFDAKRFASSNRQLAAAAPEWYMRRHACAGGGGAVVDTTCFNVQAPFLRHRLGQALFDNGAFFNHSCTPNCTWWTTILFDKKDRVQLRLRIRAAARVAAGDELTIAYVPPIPGRPIHTDAFARCICRRCRTGISETLELGSVSKKTLARIFAIDDRARKLLSSKQDVLAEAAAPLLAAPTDAECAQIAAVWPPFAPILRASWIEGLLRYQIAPIEGPPFDEAKRQIDLAWRDCDPSADWMSQTEYRDQVMVRVSNAQCLVRANDALLRRDLASMNEAFDCIMHAWGADHANEFPDLMAALSVCFGTPLGTLLVCLMTKVPYVGTISRV